MRFRARLVVAFGVVAVAPLVLLAVGVRRELQRRVGAQYAARVAALGALTREDLADQSARMAARLTALGDALADDDQFRLGVIQRTPVTRRYVLDWASRAMRLTGLSMLQIQDPSGRIISSGHFRNEYDRLEPDLPALLAAAGGAALVRARTPDGGMVAFVRVDSIRLGGRIFTMVGGIAVDSLFLARLTPGGELTVSVALPDSVIGAAPAPSDAGDVVDAFTVPYVPPVPATGARSLATARVVVTHSTAALADLRAGVDRWFAAVTIIAVIAALVAAVWLSARMSRPIVALAERTSRVDLERLDAGFATDRNDEIGVLARLLDEMMRRLRASAARLRDAERLATVGDLARQVNHDIKNGLAPIKHVLRHLSEVARDDPARLAHVFAERRATLDASVAYLDTLARTWARLTPRVDLAVCDPNEVARAVGAGVGERHVTVHLLLDPDLPRVAADPLALRRIVENLVANAVDALEARGGTVRIETRTGAAGSVHLSVADDGRGMTREQLARAGDDFRSTKPNGTGLGLSIVRRLAADIGADVRIDTAPGSGTRVTLTLRRVAEMTA